MIICRSMPITFTEREYMAAGGHSHRRSQFFSRWYTVPSRVKLAPKVG